MKKIIRPLIGVLLVLTVFSACKKDPVTDPSADFQKQLAADEILIKDYITKNNLTAIRHEKSGVYYILTNPGTGTYAYTDLSKTYITVKYEGRTLDGKVFDSNSQGIYFGPSKIPNGLAGLIVGWQIGLAPKAIGGIVEGGLQKGGKIRLLIPSGYGYGQNAAGAIKANSVLDFDIELVDIQN